MMEKYIKNALDAGKILKGKYEYKIEKVLGVGAWGITYRVSCYHGSIKHFYAIKEYFPHKWCERQGQLMHYSDAVKVKSGLESFFSEANQLKEQHILDENLVGINEVFRANNTAYYVMEYIPGYHLYEYVHIKLKRPLAEKEAKTIISPILKAVSRLHQYRITHLDIKPDNILLGKDEDAHIFRPVLIDFGLSKHYDANGKAITKTKIFAQSDGYSPCELYQEDGKDTFTPQSDVYSLAATLLFMLTNQNPEIATKITPQSIREMLDAQEGISGSIKEAILHAMENDKSKRTQSISAFADELGIDLSLGDNQLKGNPTKVLDIIPYKSYLNKCTAVASILLVLVIGAVIIYFYKHKNVDFPISPNDTITIVNQPVHPGQQEVDNPSNHVPANNEPDLQEPAGQPVPQTSEQATPISSSNSHPITNELDLGYATWKGGVKGGKPHGKGILYFTKDYTVVDYAVHAGYRLEGEYQNGELVIGEIKDASGNLLQTVVP